MAEQYFLRWARREPGAALGSALASPPDQRIAALKGTLAGWVRSDAVAAWSWLADASVQPPWVDDAIRRELGFALASGQYEPFGDANLVRVGEWTNTSQLTLESATPWNRLSKNSSGRSLDPNSEGAVRVATLIRDSAGPSSVLAADWIAAPYPPELKTDLFNVAVANWLQRGNPDEARVWLEERPSDPNLDSARATYAAAEFGRDPEAALNMLARITNDPIRAAKVLEVATVNDQAATPQGVDWVYRASRSIPAEPAFFALSAALARLNRVNQTAARAFVAQLGATEPALASRLAARFGQPR